MRLALYIGGGGRRGEDSLMVVRCEGVGTGEGVCGGEETVETE